MMTHQEGRGKVVEVGCMQGEKKKRRREEKKKRRKEGRRRRADPIDACLVIHHSSLLFTSVASKRVVLFPEHVSMPSAKSRHYSFEPSHSQK